MNLWVKNDLLLSAFSYKLWEYSKNKMCFKQLENMKFLIILALGFIVFAFCG